MIRTVLLLVRDLLHFVALTCASHTSLAAENLFLRKQLAFYVERNVAPRRLDDAARIALAMLARVIDWRQILTMVRPDTLVRWTPSGFPPVLALEVAAPWPSPKRRARSGHLHARPGDPQDVSAAGRDEGGGARRNLQRLQPLELRDAQWQPVVHGVRHDHVAGERRRVRSSSE